MNDKNTWIGLGLIALIMIGFSMFNRPSQEELARRQHVQDSLRHVEMLKQEAAQAIQMVEAQQTDTSASAVAARQAEREALYGALLPAADGDHAFVTLENERLSLVFSSRGGALFSAHLKEYHAYGDSVHSLCLFEADEQRLNFALRMHDNHIFQTADLFFVPQPVVRHDDGSQTLVMRLMTTDENAYMDFTYTLPANDYMLSFSVQPHGMQGLLAQNANALDMQWNQLIRQQERGRKFEERYARLQYMFTDGDMEKLSESKDDTQKESGKIRWIGYKDQFFSTVLIANEAFDGATLTSTLQRKGTGYIKQYQTETSVAFDPMGAKSTDFRLYMGPNHYNTLKAYDEGVAYADRLRMNQLVELGWKIVAWINRWLVIPMFDVFSSWGLHIGWVIFLMTLVIKLIIFPFTFTSFKSSAKMRVLKPQLDEINAKYPAEKMQERQQATMALYQKAGVNPMSGCLPMLFQMPVVMAMFFFFPTAFELRGQSFLWAEDLSTYDAIISWGFEIWGIGDHISLFCVLMTVTNILYTVLTMQSQSTDPNMKMMQWMMYLMPVMFFFIFNDYAAGLSYYYFISLLMTIVQTFIFRWTLNDQKVLADMEKAKAKKAAKGKSKWQMRLEEMQRQQQAMIREQAKKQAKR